MAAMTRPDVTPILALREKSEVKEIVRALYAFALSMRSFGDELDVTLDEWSVARDGQVKRGRASGGLGVGMIAYPQGDAWLPADPATSGAWARGAAVAVSDGEAVILRYGTTLLRTTDTSIAIGSVVYPASVKGSVTATRPSPGAVKFYQEVGVSNGPVRSGLVEVQLFFRIAPET